MSVINGPFITDIGVTYSKEKFKLVIIAPWRTIVDILFDTCYDVTHIIYVYIICIIRIKLKYCCQILTISGSFTLIANVERFLAAENVGPILTEIATSIENQQTTKKVIQSFFKAFR